MFNKLVIQVLASTLMITAAFTAAGQPGKHEPYLRKAAQVLNASSLQYRYTVVLVEQKGGKIIDSLGGVLYRSGRSYMDSSAASVSVMDREFLFKADRKSKIAYLYNLAAVEKKMGIKREDLNNSLLSIPDSLLAKMGQISVSSKSENFTELKYVLKQPQNGITELYLKVGNAGDALREVRLDVEEQDKWGDGTGYKRIYYLTNFSNAVPGEKTDTRKYFKQEAGKAKLLGAYKAYKLTSLL